LRVVTERTGSPLSTAPPRGTPCSVKKSPLTATRPADAGAHGARPLEGRLATQPFAGEDRPQGQPGARAKPGDVHPLRTRRAQHLVAEPWGQRRVTEQTEAARDSRRRDAVPSRAHLCSCRAGTGVASMVGRRLHIAGGPIRYGSVSG
jgi:hypothetical protein